MQGAVYGSGPRGCSLLLYIPLDSEASAEGEQGQFWNFGRPK
jgi:hypothetical protein